ncbi:hypothetical protein [Xanthomonas euvesicatoria]|uniref:hypothetical protein n=1 Tax=Xanthomonas euvesicatoria TaxID=456327 RepID=UPI001C47307D|nr:hypothetical protein [Xanthomonas euvesicatoria]MBV6895120.1 hypothetical protein [Xanthomonas campestris pv. ionidii]
MLLPKMALQITPKQHAPDPPGGRVSITGKNPPITLATPSISNSPKTSVSAQAAWHLTALMLDRIAVDASGLSDIDGPTGAYRVELRRGPITDSCKGSIR